MMAEPQELQRLRDMRRRAHEAGDENAARRFTQRIVEIQSDPNFGEMVTLPDGGRRISPLPGVDVTFPQEGVPSVRVQGPRGASLPATARIFGRFGRDLAEGLRSSAEIGLRGTALAPAGVAAGALGELPRVESAGGEERVASALLQYGGPGLATGGLIQSATSAMPWFARVGAQALGALVTDATVADPQGAETIGDVLGGPTRIQESDPDWLRKLKVSAEAGGVTGALSAISEGIIGGVRGATRLLSPQAEAEGVVRDLMRDAYRAGAMGAQDAPIDQARSALAELIEARRVYRSQGIDAVPASMRPFVANDIQITVPEYLAARQINVGPVEIARRTAGSTRISQQRAANVRAVGRGAGEVLGTDDPSAAFRVSREAAGRARGAQETAESAYENLYQQVADELERARQVADDAFDEVQSILARADENAAAGRVDEAVRAEREAAMRLRDALYNSIDPDGNVFVNPVRMRNAYSTLLDDVDPADIPGFARISRQYDRLINKGGQLSYRDILDLERRVSQLLNNMPPQAESYFNDLMRFRNTLRDGYLEELAQVNPHARQVAESAREFMREEFAPRFRQFGGADVEARLRRGEGVASREVARDFLNRDLTRTEDAGTLNRILLGTRLSDEDLARIIQARGATPPVGVAGLQTRTPEEYARSVADVRDVFLGRLAQRLNMNNPSARTAQRFLQDFGEVIDQFPPNVRADIEAVVRQIDDAENAQAVRQVLQRATERTAGLSDRLSNVNPNTAYERIAGLSRQLRDVPLSQQAQEALDAASAAARNQREVNSQRLVEYFSRRAGEEVDPQAGVRRIFSSENPSADMEQIIRELGDDDALKQAVHDYLLNSVVRIDPNVQDSRQLVQAFRRLDNFLENDRNRRAIVRLYGRRGLQSMRLLQRQLEDMNLFDMPVNNNTFGRSIQDRSVTEQMRQALIAAAGAGGGLSGRSKKLSQLQLIQIVRNAVSGNRQLEEIVNTRLVEITADPEAARLALDPLSEGRQIELAYALLVGGRDAYIAAREDFGGGGNETNGNQ